MLLTRAIPLVLVMLAACSRAPDYSGCRLVGSWVMEHELDEAETARLRDLGIDLVQHLAAAKAALEAEGVRVTETFQADGSWTSYANEGDGDPVHGQGMWVLMEDGDHGVSICIRHPKGAVADWNRSFTFETPDRIREVGDNLYTRVRATK